MSEANLKGGGQDARNKGLINQPFSSSSRLNYAARLRRVA